MKSCKICKENKQLSAFSKNSANKDGLENRCRPCKSLAQAGYVKKYRTANPEMYSPEYMRSWHLQKRYGLTKEQYEEIILQQGGHCALCPATADQTVFCIDHDHSCCPGQRSCGKCIRGVLCRNCNVALGHIKDDIETLRNMIEYLKKGIQ